MQFLPELPVVRILQHSGLCRFNLLQQLQILGIVACKWNIFKFNKRLSVNFDLRVTHLEQPFRSLVLVILKLEQEVEFHGVYILKTAEKMAVSG